MPEEKEQKITLYEEDFYEKEETKEEIVQLIVLRLSKEWYGVEITKVKEVIKIDKITCLPSVPEYIAGIVSLRGNILSVTNLKKIFDLPIENLTEKSRLVVIRIANLATGLLVDEVSEVVEIPKNTIDPALSTIPPERIEYIEGECRVRDRLIGILKVEKILEGGKV